MSRKPLQTDTLTFGEIMAAAEAGDTGFFTDAEMSRYAVETLRFAKEQIDHANRDMEFAKSMPDPSRYRTLIHLAWAVVAMRQRLLRKAPPSRSDDTPLTKSESAIRYWKEQYDSAIQERDSARALLQKEAARPVETAAGTERLMNAANQLLALCGSDGDIETVWQQAVENLREACKAVPTTPPQP